MSDDLTPRRLKLLEHEAVIERHMTADDLRFAVAGIRADRLYLERGFDTFEDYCRGWWGDQWIKLAGAEVRRELVAEKRAEGMSLRMIGAELGIDEKTARNDLNTADQSAVMPDRIIGRDGREQPAKREPRPLVKHDAGNGVPHPATYSDAILAVAAELLAGYRRVLDPFAGPGGIHRLADLGHEIGAVELEPEWAGAHPATIVGSALELPFDPASFDAVCTSPTYGNRLADHHDAADPEARRSYRHDLGRPLHVDNSGAMQWGDQYRTFHAAAWREAVRVLRPGGRFVLNIKDHVRAGRWQDVAGWHLAELCRLGLEVAAVRPVPTRGLPLGDTGEVRVGAELVIALDRAAP